MEKKRKVENKKELEKDNRILAAKKLLDEKIITKREVDIICSSLSDESLAMPFTIKDSIRAKAFKNILTTILLFKEDE